MSEDSLTPVEALRAKQADEVSSLATFVEKREEARDAFEKREKSEDAKPSDEERSAHAVAEEEFNSEFDRRDKTIGSLDRRVAEAEVVERRRQDAARASTGSATVTSEPLTYRSDNAGDHSYFRDLAARQSPTFAGQTADAAASFERLERHAKEMRVEMPRRDKERERRAAVQVDDAERSIQRSLGSPRGLAETPFETRVNPNRTDGQGGYLVPPLWLIDDYIPYLRAGRVTADLCRKMPLPTGTDSINIPKIASGTATAVQTADNAAVQSTDLTDTSVSAGVHTIAGQQDVAIQLLEQSPGQIVDQVVLQDLMADYNLRIDAQVLAGTGANGQALGILPVSNNTGANTITWTPSFGTTPSATAIGFNQAIGAAVSKTSYTRYDLTNLQVVMHPRRWFWFATALDNVSGQAPLNGRPLVNTVETGYNLAAIENNPAPYQGMVGRFPFGPTAHIDANVPAVANASGAITGGTNDLAVAAKWDDLWLFEGEMRTRVLPEILSGTLQIRFQCFNYFAFLIRYGQSIAVVQGSGMAAPTALDTSVVY
jgi:HK97 family phage major capsid protein